MVFRIWLAWTGLVFASVVAAASNFYVIALTKTAGFLTSEQLLAILVAVISWVVAQVIFGLFSKEGERRT